MGRLWRCSQWLLALTALWLVVTLIGRWDDLWPDDTSPVLPAAAGSDYTYTLADGEHTVHVLETWEPTGSVTLRGYRLSVPCAWVEQLTTYEGQPLCRLMVSLESRTWRLWEPASGDQWMLLAHTVTDDQGRAYHDRSMLVGLGPLYVSTYSEAGKFYLWPRSGDSPTLVQLPEDTRYSPQGTFHSYQDPAFLLVDAPARAQSARLHLRLTHNSFDQVYTMEGQQQGVVWFFQLEKQHYADGDRLRSAEETAFSTLWPTRPTQFCCPCTVELFDNEGALLDRLDVNGGCDLG